MHNKLFSTKDPLGDDSNLIRNFYNHARSKKHSYSWGSNKHTRNLFPRGKAYDRMWGLQLDNYINNNY